MLSENRSRIDAGLLINQKYVKSRLSVLYEYIPRCENAGDVNELKEEQRLLRKHKKEMNK